MPATASLQETNSRSSSEDKYASYREFARDELTKFYGWLQHIQGVDDDTN